MLLNIWQNYIFIPLVNFLIYLYGTIAFQNYALAIIELVITMRILLLPLSFIEEKNRSKIIALSDEIAYINKKYKNDDMAQKKLIRLALKKNKVNPWAKIASLSIQAFILIVFYWVNVKSFKYLDRLYPFVPKVDQIDTTFWGLFDLLKPNFYIALIASIYFFINILYKHAQRKKILTEGDKVYRYLFPTFMFLFLVFLPSAKSLFVLTSMVFLIFYHF